MNPQTKDPTAKMILGFGAILAAPLFVGATLAGAIGSAAPMGARVAATGGLSLSPPIVQGRAKVGTTVTATVVNTSEHQVRVTLRPRPWVQAPDGTVAPDVRRNLTGLVRTSPASFVMAANGRRTVRLTLRRNPREARSMARSTSRAFLAICPGPTRSRRAIA